MTSFDTAPAGRFSRLRRDFRRWRRARPFWGGLLMMLSGIELFGSSNLDLGGLQVHEGYEGFLSYLLPALMVIVGVFVWVTPKQKNFYSIIGLVTAVYSLVGLNLGGWFLGMAIGIVGGALGFAWSPVTPVPPRSDGPTGDDDEAAATTGLSTRDDADGIDAFWGESAAGEPGPVPRGGGGPTRSPGAMLVIVPLLLVLGAATTVVSTPRAAFAATCTTSTQAQPAPSQAPALPLDPLRQLLDWIYNGPADQTCPSAAVAADIGAGTPTPSESAPSSPAASDPAPSDPAPTTTASTEPTPTTTASTEPTPTDPASGPTSPPATVQPSAGGPTSTSHPKPPATGGPAPTATAAPKIATAAAGQPLVAVKPAKMTASVLTLEGFSYDGVATLPTAQGPVRALRFSMDTATNADFTLVVSGGGRTLETATNPLVAHGHVSFYASQFSGDLLGTPLTFTPDAPPPATLPLMVFTNVSVDLVYLNCDTLELPSLAQTLSD